MSIRTCLTVWALTLVVPVLAAHPSLVPYAPSCLGVGEAHAQDAATEQARQWFLEGVKAYDAGRYEEARTNFLQAYAIKRHPAVLLNLGQSELKAGYPVDGGNHLQQFLREHTGATDAQKEAARASIREARTKAGFIVVMVSRDGADVGIDGRFVGRTPLLDPVFVTPGAHTVTASLGGETAQTTVTAGRGSATPANLELRGGGDVPPAPVPVPAQPEPLPPPLPSPPSPSPLPAPVYPPYGPVAPQPTPVGPGIPPDRPAATSRQNFFKWYPKKPLAWVFTGVGGLGLVGTIAFGAAAADASASANSVSDQILAEVNRTNNLPDSFYSGGDRLNGTPQPCGNIDNPDSAFSYYRSACDTLRDNIDAHDVDIALMVTSIVIGVGGTGALVVYYFVDAKEPAQGQAKESSSGPRILGVSPIITPQVQGLGLTGSF